MRLKKFSENFLLVNAFSGADGPDKVLSLEVPTRI
jgi:hypothetical protein